MRAICVGNVFSQIPKVPPVQGRVHSVFDRVVNFEIPREDLIDNLLSIGRADVAESPAMVVADTPMAFSWGALDLHPGEPVLITEDTVALGDRCVIQTGSARVWNGGWEALPELDCLPSAQEALNRGREAVQELMREGDVFASRSPLFSGLGMEAPPSPLTDPFLWKLCQGIGGMRLWAEQTSAALEGPAAVPDRETAALIGLGGGLTPAGDDFLVGLLLALAFFQQAAQRESRLLGILREAVSRMRGETNRISRHFLSYALAGLCGRPQESFLRALVEKNCEEKLRRAARDIAAIGSTSGMDELAGLLYGILFAGLEGLLPRTKEA